MSRVLRVLPSARADVTASFNHLQHQGSPAAAWRFIEGVEESFERIQQMPFIGAPRKFRSARLRNLRQWPVKGFEDFLIFYRITARRIDVYRILHGRRDLEAIFAEPS